jgi:hypothetical protein
MVSSCLQSRSLEAGVISCARSGRATGLVARSAGQQQQDKAMAGRVQAVRTSAVAMMTMRSLAGLGRPPASSSGAVPNRFFSASLRQRGTQPRYHPDRAEQRQEHGQLDAMFLACRCDADRPEQRASFDAVLGAELGEHFLR